RANGSKMRSRSSAGTGGPSLVTRTQASAPAEPVSTTIDERAWRAALASRLRTTRVTRSGPGSTTGGDDGGTGGGGRAGQPGVAALEGGGGGEAVEHVVERAGQAGDLVVAGGGGEAVVEGVGLDLVDLGGHGVDRRQRPAHGPPGEQPGQEHQCRDADQRGDL